MEIKTLRRVRAESSRRPPRHRRDAGSTAAPDALVDFHTGRGAAENSPRGAAWARRAQKAASSRRRGALSRTGYDSALSGGGGRGAALGAASWKTPTSASSTTRPPPPRSARRAASSAKRTCRAPRLSASPPNKAARTRRDSARSLSDWSLRCASSSRERSNARATVASFARPCFSRCASNEAHVSRRSGRRVSGFAKTFEETRYAASTRASKSILWPSSSISKGSTRSRLSGSNEMGSVSDAASSRHHWPLRVGAPVALAAASRHHRVTSAFAFWASPPFASVASAASGTCAGAIRRSAAIAAGGAVSPRFAPRLFFCGVFAAMKKSAHGAGTGFTGLPPQRRKVRKSSCAGSGPGRLVICKQTPKGCQALTISTAVSPLPLPA